MNTFKDDEHKKAGEHAKEAAHQGKEVLKQSSDHALGAGKNMKDQAGGKLHSAKEWAQESGKETKSGVTSTLHSAKEQMKSVPSALKKGAEIVKDKFSRRENDESK